MPPPRKRQGRPATTSLTPAQERAFEAIQRLIEQNHRPPTMQELATLLGVTATSAHEQVNQLVKKGYLQRDPGKARNLVVTRNTRDAIPALIEIPVIGLVAAGGPMLAEENVVGHVLIEESLAPRGKCFALRVRGDSMIEAQINDGDLVIVRQQQVASNGDIVVALLEGDATVKRLAITEDSIQLLPANPQYQPLTIDPDHDFRIVGKVVGVRRARSSPT